jgi:hypothetical protein
MEAPRRHLTLLPGGKESAAPDGPPEARPGLRLVSGDHTKELETALADAVETARQMRLEIERRIARALEAFEDRR